MRFHYEKNILTAEHNGELLQIEAWGENSLRIRSTMYPKFTGNTWALTERLPSREESDKSPTVSAEINRTTRVNEWEESVTEPYAHITNGSLTVEINYVGVLSFYKDNKLILREYYRNYDGTISKESRCLKTVNREYKPWAGGDYRLTVRFDSNDTEKIFGMGQYQMPYLNLKGCTLELAQKNSQVSVPFMVSSLGYGLLWNNPAVGSVTFGKNLTEWTADAAKEMDYWITAADTPAKIVEQYTAVTGRAPMIRDDVLGLWQCKLRYRTQEEVLTVARKYHELEIPLDVIVIDFFHWTYQGDYKFDKKYWPDPASMVKELHDMGIKVAVSVWPSVDKKSENFSEMADLGLLMKTERGSNQTYDYQGDCVEIDATNPKARDYIWEKCKQNYYDYGIDFFWLDNSEPDLIAYDYDNYRYYLGPAMECSNLYPQCLSRAFYEHETALGNEKPVNLLRSCWAGSQKYGNILWSGDVPSTFEALRDQISAGLNICLAGIPWWTTDIGGFMTDDVNDPVFRQLLIRWFEFAVFTPILRMHGNRGPYNIPILDDRDFGGGYLFTGQPNELWSYGEGNLRIMKDQLKIRLELKPYIKKLYEEAHENGSPLMRPLFYEFPEDQKCWSYDDSYMFGSKYLVSPIVHYNESNKDVYLPDGKWLELDTQKIYEGSTTVTASAPLSAIPVFKRMR